MFKFHTLEEKQENLKPIEEKFKNATDKLNQLTQQTEEVKQELLRLQGEYRAISSIKTLEDKEEPKEDVKPSGETK